MKVERAVIDTSILISAALSPLGKPSEVVDRLVEAGTLVFSSKTFDELASRLCRPKFERYLQASERRLFLEKLAAVAHWVEIAGNLKACRDPNDDMFLETAIAGRADALISGDQDLLVLDPFGSIRIVTASLALVMLTAT